MLLDEGKAFAARAANQGVSVVWEEWEAMPHCFAQVLGDSLAGKKCYAQLANFCESALSKGEKGIGAVRTKGTWYEAKTGKERSIKVENLRILDEDEIRRMMREAREERADMEEVIDKRSPKL